jgi:hypothetical protein
VFRRGPDGQLHPIPGWHTTGPFDFAEWSHNIDWDGVGKDLSDIGLGAFQFMNVLSPAAGLGHALNLMRRRRVGDSIDGHHPYPRFLGGRNQQELVELPRDFHRMFHRRLKADLRGTDVPRVGGRRGGMEDWDRFFNENPPAQDWAEDVLQQVSRDFDIERGTSIRPSLERELRMARPKRPPAEAPPD